jgi:hypothetical protein
MAKQRVPLNRPSTRKRAEVGDGKPSDSTQFSASNQTDHATSGADEPTQLREATAMDRRAYEADFVTKCAFVILPGENPREFEILLTRLLEERSPDGPLEQDLVLTIAKCLWRKQRYQYFLAARVTAQFHQRREPYDEAMVLNAICIEIDHAARKDAGDFREIRRCLEPWGVADFADHLEATCPRREFRSEWDWIKAMQTELKKNLPPAATRVGNPPDEVLFKQSSAIVTDDVLARELEFEQLNNRILEQALTQLEKIKKSKQQTSFREAQRLDRARRGLVIGLVK